ncbi:hypothetical protein R20233_01436 [Ralstonia sp. LMG 32965]|jgi:hypothetical protein|uniref:hypothetical protein n=1 Tax=Ralstonia TaxID=48736 RepID=UPI0028F54501|nr:hypothetical protein [Ralstonia sp. LMG 32965]CAJ0867697.1 hypothetical protein R20233_01436 [Ralstonia sp. LMG 32965]
MGSFSIWHWLIVLLVLLFVYLLPAGLIARKAGYSSGWALLMLVPLVNVITIWVFALSDWPAARK